MSCQRAEDGYFEVETILDKRVNPDGTADYLVKWKGYPMTQRTWEPEDSLAYAQSAILEYEQSQNIPGLDRDKPRKVAQKSTRGCEEPMPRTEELRIVGVRKNKGELMWTAEPVTGGLLVELSMKQAREKAPQALLDYLLMNLRFA